MTWHLSVYLEVARDTVFINVGLFGEVDWIYKNNKIRGREHILLIYIGRKLTGSLSKEESVKLKIV